MRYGTFSWFGYEMHHEQRFPLIRQAGFDAVCLWWGDEYRDVDGDKQTLPDMARAHGFAVDNVHATFAQANTLWTAAGEDSAAYRTYRDAIEDCARHGIPAVVMHFSQGDDCPPPNETGLDNVRRLTELAERLGVVAALENLRSPAHLEYLFSHIDSPNLGFC